MDGKPIRSSTVVTGLTSGEEVNVSITDAGGTTSQSWIYLPERFPAMEVIADAPGQQPGDLFMTLGSFAYTETFETVVDHHGVPRWVDTLTSSDLKVSDATPTQYSVARREADGYHIVVLDDRLHVVTRHRIDEPAGQNTTDFHDSELLPGGRTLLVGYDASAHPGQVDALIQIVDAAGHATFTWNSGDHAGMSESYVHPNGDYAHINSVQMLGNGDILASFRNLSQVMRIATTAHDGYQPGDVEWRLGGQRNDFTFVDDPDGGNCAQHMARMLPNGNLMLFDNGSKNDPSGLIGPQTADMCPDPAHPGGGRIARAQSRVTEYQLDVSGSTHTATLVHSLSVPGRYAAFAGSQQPLANGDTLVGWSFDTEAGGAQGPVVSELSASNQEIWGLRAVGWFSYRVYKYPAPDAIPPTISYTGPTSGASYHEGDRLPVSFSCTDAGGSNLQQCQGNVPTGGLASTTPGRHVLTVTARDGHGNVTARRVTYAVRAVAQPDLSVRRPGGSVVGNDVYRTLGNQTLTATARHRRTRSVDVLLQNDGFRSDRFRVGGVRGGHRFRVRYLHGSTDVTARVVSGTLSTGTLAPGRTYVLRLRMTRHGAFHAHAGRAFVVRAVSTSAPARFDNVAVVRR